MSDSILQSGPASAPTRPAGKDVDALGPSDTSDSGSDVQGERAMPTRPDDPDEWGALPTDGSSDSDAFGTGERASADAEQPREAADLLPDRIDAASLVEDETPADLDTDPLDSASDGGGEGVERRSGDGRRRPR
jgi:hypothetical protein